MPRSLTIGTVKPSDQKHGQLMLIDAQPILKNLQRPVQFATNDLNW